jgi:hypothetical protein
MAWGNTIFQFDSIDLLELENRLRSVSSQRKEAIETLELPLLGAYRNRIKDLFATMKGNQSLHDRERPESHSFWAEHHGRSPKKILNDCFPNLKHVIAHDRVKTSIKIPFFMHPCFLEALFLRELTFRGTRLPHITLEITAHRVFENEVTAIWAMMPNIATHLVDTSCSKFQIGPLSSDKGNCTVSWETDEGFHETRLSFIHQKLPIELERACPTNFASNHISNGNLPLGDVTSTTEKGQESIRSGKQDTNSTANQHSV